MDTQAGEKHRWSGQETSYKCAQWAVSLYVQCTINTTNMKINKNKNSSLAYTVYCFVVFVSCTTCIWTYYSVGFIILIKGIYIFFSLLFCNLAIQAWLVY